MDDMAAPPPPPSTGGGMGHDHSAEATSMNMAMSHMTFFWGKNSEILFSGWPGTRTGMYVLALVSVFVLSVILEWLSNCQRFKKERCGDFSGGLIRTMVHGIRVALAYLLMLAIMSFNVGVFIVAIVGHSLGFFLFGTRVFFNKAGDHSDKDFPPPAVCA